MSEQQPSAPRPMHEQYAGQGVELPKHLEQATWQADIAGRDEADVKNLEKVVSSQESQDAIVMTAGHDRKDVLRLATAVDRMTAKDIADMHKKYGTNSTRGKIADHIRSSMVTKALASKYEGADLNDPNVIVEKGNLERLLRMSKDEIRDVYKAANVYADASPKLEAIHDQEEFAEEYNTAYDEAAQAHKEFQRPHRVAARFGERVARNAVEGAKSKYETYKQKRSDRLTYDAARSELGDKHEGLVGRLADEGLDFDIMQTMRRQYLKEFNPFAKVAPEGSDLSSVRESLSAKIIDPMIEATIGEDVKNRDQLKRQMRADIMKFVTMDKKERQSFGSDYRAYGEFVEANPRTPELTSPAMRAKALGERALAQVVALRPMVAEAVRDVKEAVKTKNETGTEPDEQLELGADILDFSANKSETKENPVEQATVRLKSLFAEFKNIQTSNESPEAKKARRKSLMPHIIGAAATFASGYMIQKFSEKKTAA